MDLYLLQKYIGSGKWKISKVTNDREEASLWDMCGDENAALKITLSDMSEGRILFMDIDRGLWAFSERFREQCRIYLTLSIFVI